MPEETKDKPEIKNDKKVKKKRSLFRRIVNYFLYFFLGIFILVLIVLGITQTSTFREYLRKTVIEQANANLNGKVFIEKIDGTILTSLILRNTVVNMGKDTLLHAGIIEVKTSPLQLLLKKIKVRYFEIKDAQISFIEDSTGSLNVARLVPPSAPDTTAPGKFPFKIEVAEFKLTNVGFALQRYDLAKSTASYDSLNMKDFRAKNINLDLYAFADISEKDFELELNHFSLIPNINNLELKNLTGSFKVNPERININGLYLKTKNSDVNISVKTNNLNLFDSTAFSRIGETKVDLSLKSGKLSVDDFVPFVSSMDKMKGAIATDIELSGALNNLQIDKLEINYLATRLATKGSVKNLMNPESMYIRAGFYDSYVNAADIMRFMPSLDLNKFKDLGIVRFDTLTYDGSIKNFKTNVTIKTDKGIISANGRLNFESSLLGYNFNISTKNLDISTFAGISSNINLKGTVEGKGTSPAEMEAKVNLVADGSVIRGIQIDTLRFSAGAQNKLIDYNLNTSSGSMGAGINGKINFTSSANPSYELEGIVRDFNLQTFTKDTSSKSDINFTLKATGENFDPELMNLYLTLTFYKSSINGISFDTTRAIVDLRRDDGGQRVINFISDLADVTFIGNFSVPKTISLMSNESGIITSILNKKLNQILPSVMKETNLSIEPLIKEKPKNFVESKDSLTSITYLIDLKSLDLLSLFLGSNKIEVDGDISGKIINSGDSLNVTMNAGVDYVKLWGKDNVFFLSNLNMDLSLSYDMNADSFDDINANLNLTTDRVFAGTDIHKLSFSMELKKQVADINFFAQVENYANTKITGKLDLSGSEIAVSLDTLDLTYNRFTLVNDSTINLNYSDAGIDIKNFVLVRSLPAPQVGKGSISLKGNLVKSGNQNLVIGIKDFNGRDVVSNLLEMNQTPGGINTFNAIINMDSKIAGSLSDPLIDLHVKVDSIKYQNTNFGSMITDLNYKEKNLKVDTKFTDSIITASKPAMELSGNIPINLAFTGAEERFSKTDEMKLTLTAENFNLGVFGDILPEVNKLRGSMTAELNITGSPDNINPSGYIRLVNTTFIAKANNLEYNAGLKVSITKDYISLDSLMIKNSEGTKGGGTMTGSGKAMLKNMSIISSQFSINGQLKVLDDISKSASPAAYGSLVIATRGNVEFIADENQTKLTAPITIKEAKLTFPPTQGAYQNTTTNFIYKYIQDTTLGKSTGPDFETLINLSKARSAQQQASTGKTRFFNFSIDIQVEEEATIIFVLSRELNQNLTAVLSGNMVYERIDGQSNAQGELKLLQGSTLEFIKTLEATGSLRFENDLTNPNLNITATYLGYYYEDASTSGNGSGGTNKEVPVAVKIKINGPLKELNKSFIKEENNIAVYYGQSNIDNDTPSPEYDKSDAFYFIITGSFVKTKSADPNNMYTSQATSIAGSVLGGFLNKEFGDYVKSIELRQSNGETKFNLSGKWNKFRYSIGGDNKIFNDVTRANVKIEYPLIENFILRYERKDDINNETSISNDMINEVGLRYRFEF